MLANTARVVKDKGMKINALEYMRDTESDIQRRRMDSADYFTFLDGDER